MINWRLKTRDLQPIGLDIGHNSIKMIQLAVNGEDVSVLAADKVRIDSDISNEGTERRDFIVSAVKKMLVDGNFNGREVVSCLSNDELKITSLRLVEMSEAEIEPVLNREVAQRFGMDPTKDSINYLIAGDVRHGDEVKNELIVFAARDETIRSHIEMLEEAKLVSVGIDTIACALFRSFERSLRRQEDKKRTVVFVDVGNRFTTVVFGRGLEISFVKQIPIGSENFNQEIASKLGVSIEEAEVLRGKLKVEETVAAHSSVSEESFRGDSTEGNKWSPALKSSLSVAPLDGATRRVVIDSIETVAERLSREISLCFRYYTVTFRGNRVEEVVFAGGGAHESILLDTLRRQLGIEVEVAQPLRGFDLSSKKINASFHNNGQESHCEWAVAVGLSLKAGSESVNL